MTMKSYSFENNNYHYIKKCYSDNGFVIIKNFFKSKNINKIKKEILKQIKNKEYSFYYENINNKKKLRRIERISEFSKKSKKLLISKNVFQMIKLLEKKEFTLFKDKLNFKYPGGSGFLPHIDGHFFWRDKNNKKQNGWSKYSTNFTSLVVPLESINLKNGCIFLSNKKNTKKLGSNFLQITKKLIMNTPNIKKKHIDKFKFFPIEMEIGDVCFFNWKCAHYSKINRSNKSRMIFYATYSLRNKLKNIRKKYYFDKKNSLTKIKFKSLLFN